MTTPDYEPLWRWVCKREEARIRKDAGFQPPYAADPIIGTYRFCNVRREDDRGTVWIRKNIREPFADARYLWLMLCIARQINWPDTIAELIAERAWPMDEDFDPSRIAHVLNARKQRGDKIYTGAYMISAPAKKGADKQAYIAETVIGALWRRRESFIRCWSDPSLRRIHSLITVSNGWGAFMAYQAVVDMRFTRLLNHAYDIDKWAAAGPGTLRGLNRLHGRATDFALSQSQALTEMRTIFDLAKSATGVSMDFSDVPNILCETDKYLRVHNGEGKPRALYIPGRGS